MNMYYYKETNYEYKMQCRDEFIESEMHKVSDEALKKLTTFFVHPTLSIKTFSLAIAYGYFESDVCSENVAHELGLGKLEFFAIAEDFDAFKEEYLKDMELAQNF